MTFKLFLSFSPLLAGQERFFTTEIKDREEVRRGVKTAECDNLRVYIGRLYSTTVYTRRGTPGEVHLPMYTGRDIPRERYLGYSTQAIVPRL